MPGSAQHLPHRHFSQRRVGIDHIEYLTHGKFTFTQCTLNFLAVCSGKYRLLAGGGAHPQLAESAAWLGPPFLRVIEFYLSTNITRIAWRTLIPSAALSLPTMRLRTSARKYREYPYSIAGVFALSKAGATHDLIEQAYSPTTEVSKLALARVCGGKICIRMYQNAIEQPQL